MTNLDTRVATLERQMPEIRELAVGAASDASDAKAKALADTRLIDALNRNHLELKEQMHEGFAKVDERFAKVDERFAKLETRVDDLETKMHQGFADIRTEMHAGFADIRTEVRQSYATLHTGMSKITDLLTVALGDRSTMTADQPQPPSSAACAPARRPENTQSASDSPLT